MHFSFALCATTLSKVVWHSSGRSSAEDHLPGLHPAPHVALRAAAGGGTVGGRASAGVGVDGTAQRHCWPLVGPGRREEGGRYWWKSFARHVQKSLTPRCSAFVQ